MARETVYDPTEGLTERTTKEEMRDRLRKAGAAIRRFDRSEKKRLAEIEERLRAKFAAAQVADELQQVIVSATLDEWRTSVEFLEEFDDLLPVALKRLVVGGRVMLDHDEDGNA